MSSTGDQPGGFSRRLADVPFAEQSWEGMVQQIVAVAVMAVSGSGGAGLTVSDDGHGKRFTWSQGIARRS